MSRFLRCGNLHTKGRCNCETWILRRYQQCSLTGPFLLPFFIVLSLPVRRKPQGPTSERTTRPCGCRREGTEHRGTDEVEKTSVKGEGDWAAREQRPSGGKGALFCSTKSSPQFSTIVDSVITVIDIYIPLLFGPCRHPEWLPEEWLHSFIEKKVQELKAVLCATSAFSRQLLKASNLIFINTEAVELVKWARFNPITVHEMVSEFQCDTKAMWPFGECTFLHSWLRSRKRQTPFSLPDCFALNIGNSHVASIDAESHTAAPLYHSDWGGGKLHTYVTRIRNTKLNLRPNCLYPSTKESHIKNNFS